MFVEIPTMAWYAVVSLIFFLGYILIRKYNLQLFTGTISTFWNKNTVDAVFSSPERKAEHFQAIFESAPACFKLQNRDGTLARINQSGMDLLDAKEHSDIVGKSIYAFIVPKYRFAYRQMSWAVFRGQSGYLEFEMITLNHRRRWMRTNAEPLRDRNRVITHLIAITHDITDNRMMSQQLEAHRNKLQTIIESEPECVKLQDQEGHIMEMNPAGLALLEARSPDDVVGKSMYDFIASEYTLEYRNLTDRVFAGERVSMEFEVFSINNRRHWMKTHAAPLHDSTGRVTALLAITRNIDQRKKHEARLYEQQIELARVCRLSTMGEMATSLAHELNQPLCAVSSYAESARLLDIGNNNELNEILQKIVQQSWRATKIVQNMRTFVKKQSPRPETITAKSLVKSSVEFLEPTWRRELINVHINLQDDLKEVCADRVQIEQVLLNLLSNAIQAVKALPIEERIVIVEVTGNSEGEQVFKVINQGTDIAAEIIEELFTPFFTTKETGLGMGLAISRSIVESNGGQIWYDFQPGYGPCFCFTLAVDDGE